MVLGEISKEYVDKIFDENGAVGTTLPLKPDVARVVGRLLYVDDPNAITVSEGRTTLKRLVTPNKTVVFSVYGSKLASGKVDVHVGGTYIDTSPGAPRVAAISSDDEKKIGDGVFQLLSAYINIKIKQPHRDLSKELIKTQLPVDVNRLIREMAYGEIPPSVIIKRKYAGKRRTRKGKKRYKKTRKSRR